METLECNIEALTVSMKEGGTKGLLHACSSSSSGNDHQASQKEKEQKLSNTAPRPTQLSKTQEEHMTKEQRE